MPVRSTITNGTGERRIPATVSLNYPEDKYLKNNLT